MEAERRQERKGDGKRRRDNRRRAAEKETANKSRDSKQIRWKNIQRAFDSCVHIPSPSERPTT